jgi:c(7)-type cytochrome triheme protein
VWRLWPPILLAVCCALLPNAAATETAVRNPPLRPYVPKHFDDPARAPQAEPEEHATRRNLRKDFLDPTNPDLHRLQDPDTALAALPKDALGFPDWMRALRDGLISPRGGLLDDGPGEQLDLDVVMRNTRQMPWVRFPHRAHTQWLACSNCHPKPFEARAGSSEIQMADIFRGRYCGMCHDRVAFVTFFTCQRCHAVPQPGAALPR